MAGLNIPGVTDQYNTTATIEKLMQVERIPLTREQNQLDDLKSQKDAWRDVTSKLSTLRDSTKSLYSFDNPFNNKLTTSSEEAAVTAEASRSADIQSFKVDVIQPASADRLLTDELDKDFKVEKGLYTFKIAEKKIAINWKGGSLKDFSDAINKRSNGSLKTMIIGASADKKTFLIESTETGKENKLYFEDDAKKFAINTGILIKDERSAIKIGEKITDFSNLSTEINKDNENTSMPKLSFNQVSVGTDKITVNSRGAFELALPKEVSNLSNPQISLVINSFESEDITDKINKENMLPEIPSSGSITYGGITINNKFSDSTFVIPNPMPEPLSPISDENILFVKYNDGSQKEIAIGNIFSGEDQNISFDGKNVVSIVIQNRNTGRIINISDLKATTTESDGGYIAKNPISEADDAIIKYEGITINRPSNKIDDVIPEITLNLHDKTEKTATLEVKPDVDSSKEALITFVGKYNQAVAELNILGQNKPELVEELEYLSDEEREKAREKLGLFQTDFSISSMKSNMQTIVNTGYKTAETAEVTMLSQIGISSNASGFSTSYSQSKLRGYLEIDEKTLDSALENHLDDIKRLFGFDSDGDLIVDSGIAYQLDKQLSAYTQTGGILAMKTSSLDSKIKSSEQRISKLESQMNDKEAELRRKFSSMEGSLNSLESQQNSISNFTKQQNKSN